MQILYEDKYLTVINKPEGLLCVPFPGSHEKTVLDVLCEMRRQRGMVHGSFRPIAVHRLDKPTSGVMMFALVPEIQKKIMDNWQSVVTRRIYHAVAENPVDNGRFKILPDSGTIDLPLIENDRHHSYVFENRIPNKTEESHARYDSHRRNHNQNHNRNRQTPFQYEKLGAGNIKRNGVFRPDETPVNAVTHYKILERGRSYTMFELELETGRTNQIRAHLSYLGYTLVGDKTYHAKTNPVKRLCLHARTLTFVHPVTGKTLSFEVPEPESWLKLVRQ